MNNLIKILKIVKVGKMYNIYTYLSVFNPAT